MTGSALADLISWLVEKGGAELDAEVVTAPVVIQGDGQGGSTYACDVRIAGQQDVIKNVPISSAAGAVQYAAIGSWGGSAVRVARSPITGKMEIVGFSKRKPGFFHRYSVALDTGVTGAVENVTITSRRLTFGELADYAGGFGSCPLGAYAIFRGSTLLEVRA